MYACARIVGRVVGPDGHPLPRRAFVLIRAGSHGGSPNVLPAFERADSTGRFDFMIMAYSGDSASVPEATRMSITATWRDDSRQMPAGTPQPVLGMDSLDLRVIFAPYGAVAPVDTLVFHLGPPSSDGRRP
jgi:hypothetical protein